MEQINNSNNILYPRIRHEKVPEDNKRDQNTLSIVPIWLSQPIVSAHCLLWQIISNIFVLNDGHMS